MAAEAGVAEAVHFVGLLSHEQYLQLLWGAAVLVVPRIESRATGAAFPTRLAEYLATGRPVVTTTVSGVKELLTDGVDALLVPPGDPRALADALAQLLGDSPAADEIGRRGKAISARAFDRAQGCRLVAAAIRNGTITR